MKNFLKNIYCMARCLADSLLANNFKFSPIDLRIRFLLWWHFGYNNGNLNVNHFFKILFRVFNIHSVLGETSVKVLKPFITTQVHLQIKYWVKITATVR